MNQPIRMMKRTTTTIGMITETKETTVEVMSSTTLTGMLPVPAVVAVTAGLTTALLTA
jgi:hypothetical protein